MRQPSMMPAAGSVHAPPKQACSHGMHAPGNLLCRRIHAAGQRLQLPSLRLNRLPVAAKPRQRLQRAHQCHRVCHRHRLARLRDNEAVHG